MTDATASGPAGYVPPGIPVSASALIFDRAGRLLILKPTYKSGWTIPGGVMEADGETPWQACQREVREECGLQLRAGSLACMDFRPPAKGRPGGIRYLFDCGALPDDALSQLDLQAAEIEQSRIVPVTEAIPLLRKPIRRRVLAVRRCDGRPRKRPAIYLEDGRPVAGVGLP